MSYIPADLIDVMCCKRAHEINAPEQDVFMQKVLGVRKLFARGWWVTLLTRLWRITLVHQRFALNPTRANLCVSTIEFQNIDAISVEMTSFS